MIPVLMIRQIRQK